VIDPKATKPCEWCGGEMHPRYNPNRGHYESEHWERPEAFAIRRFCSRYCQNSSMAHRRIYSLNQNRNDEIKRLSGLGWTPDRIAAQLQVTRGVVMGVVQRARRHGPRRVGPAEPAGQR
jgi:hypothetical protein